jgi:IrrE N-terminal-like domain
MSKPTISDLTRRQIRAAAELAIRRAGVAGIVPTPLDAVSRVAGIVETLDLSDIPPDLVARRPSAWRRVLGAVLYRQRVIVVDRSQGGARGRFIEAHELSHKFIASHETLVRLDDEGRLFGHVKRAIEHEADIGAAELLFQGDLFVRRALEFRVSIAAPIGLAPEFGASLTAAVRHYADYHPDPVAVIVAGRFLRSNRCVPIWGAHESPSFRVQFGPALAVFPAGVPASDLHEHPAGAIVHEALAYGEIAEGEVDLLDLRGEPRKVVVEAFCNQYLSLIMLTEKRASKTIGRRIDVRAG